LKQYLLRNTCMSTRSKICSGIGLVRFTSTLRLTKAVRCVCRDNNLSKRRPFFENFLATRSPRPQQQEFAPKEATLLLVSHAQSFACQFSLSFRHRITDNKQGI
jgi:hypothetical protein